MSKKQKKFDPKKINLRVSRQVTQFEDNILLEQFIQRSLTLPFVPQWSFGIDPLTKFINLTKEKSTLRLFYTVTHVGIVYSHSTKDMQFLVGHKNLITSISNDESGRWLVTADEGIDNTIIVWDGDDGFPVRTVFDPHPIVGVKLVAISHDAKYLTSVGNEENPMIKFWLWTHGRDYADGMFQCKSSYGEVNDIKFNPNETTHFAVTFTEALIFFTWRKKKKMIEHSVGKVPHKRNRNFGSYTNLTYIPNSHECLTVTSNGWVLVWGLTFFNVPYESMPDDNNKLFLKAIRLQRNGIASICFVDGVISTTDTEGNIRFYDLQLKILYFFHKNYVPPILYTAFNLGPRKFTIQDPELVSGAPTIEKPRSENEDNLSQKSIDREENAEQGKVSKSWSRENLAKPEEEKEEEEEDEEEKKIKEEHVKLKRQLRARSKEKLGITDDDDDEEFGDSNFSYPSDEDRSEDYEKIYLNLLPSDFTLERAPFLVRDYIILTADGQFAYVDAVENKLDYFLSSNFCPCTSIDVHCEKPILILGYQNGQIFTYNYDTFDLIVRRQLMESKEANYNIISAIRYSPEGLFLACGTGGGHLFFLDPVTIEPLNEIPFVYEHCEILDIKFSLDNQYLAYYDENRAVCLLKRKEGDHVDEKPVWLFYGRIIVHTLDITGMLFCEKNRLFTIGKDKNMVEYYVHESQPGKLDVLSKVPVVQRGYPVAFITYDVMNDEDNVYFLISTNEYKYLIVSEQTSTLERTIVAPFPDKPIEYLQIIPNKDDKYMIFSTGKYMGIQMLPLSGNPYKQVSLMAASIKLRTFRISYCGNYVFTLGENDNVSSMWSIRTGVVDHMFEQGGQQLTPYYALIEGGVDGWLFNEIKDLFYYMQILHQGEDSPFPRNVSDKIPCSELPNLMRAIGYYPTEYELDNILYEVKYYYLDDNDEKLEEEELNFENFVKIYINHRPVRSFKRQEVKWAFEKLGYNGKISRNNFIKTLCNKGECFSSYSLQHCLSILTHHTKGEQILRYAFHEILPEELDYEYFMSEILGMEENEI